MEASPQVKAYQCLFTLSSFKEHTCRVFIYLCGSLTKRESVFNMASSHCVTFAVFKESHSEILEGALYKVIGKTAGLKMTFPNSFSSWLWVFNIATRKTQSARFSSNN